MSNLKRPFRIVSVGDLVTDIIVAIPQLPVEANINQIVKTIQFEPGGAGNFLLAGARLGMKMVALGAIGADVFGSAAIEALEQEGIDCMDVIIQADGTTTSVFVLVDQNGQHVFLGKYGDGPEISFSSRWEKAINDADVVLGWGYTLHEKRLAQTLLHAMHYAHHQKVPVFFDPGPFVADATDEQRVIILENSDVIILTEEEIPLLVGYPSTLEDIQKIIENGPKMICVKRGAQGCIIFTQSDRVEHPGFPVTVRDTTAAGDSFAAAFIYAYQQKWPLEHIALFANAMGAAKVEKFGSGRQVPTADEIRQLLNRYHVDLPF